MKRIDVAIAIIHEGTKVLICQRHKNDSFADLWEFPGGKVEAGETPLDCLHREAQEELGVLLADGDPFPTIDHTYPNLIVHLMPFLCTIASGDPQPLAAQRLRWVDAQNLRHYPFPAANAVLIEQIIERLFATSSETPRADY